MAKGLLRDLGPCDVIFGGISLGENMSVVFRASDDAAEVKTAKAGSSPVDHIYTGSKVSCEVNMTRTQYAQFVAGFPGASGSGTSGAQVVFRSTVGRSIRDNAKTLVLKPIIGPNVSVNSAEWLTIFLAGPRPDFEITYDESSQRIFKVTFEGLVVEEAGTPAGTQVGWLWKIGA